MTKEQKIQNSAWSELQKKVEFFRVLINEFRKEKDDEMVLKLEIKQILVLIDCLCVHPSYTEKEVKAQYSRLNELISLKQDTLAMEKKIQEATRRYEAV